MVIYPILYFSRSIFKVFFDQKQGGGKKKQFNRTNNKFYRIFRQISNNFVQIFLKLSITIDFFVVFFKN